MFNDTQPDPDELEQWSNEFDRLHAELKPYRERMWAKQNPGGAWLVQPTKEERTFEALFYFWSAALANESDVFGYLDFIIQNKDRFLAIGAKGCLAALDALLPYYQEQQGLPTDQQRNEYRWRMEDKIQQGAALAEEINAFGQLLLAYARQNAHRIG